MTPNNEVDEYLAAAPLERRQALTELRDACLRFLPGFIETFHLGMPSYEREDGVEIAFASQKQYLSFYVSRTDVIDAHRPRLDGLDIGKGYIRHESPEEVDLDVINSILKMNAMTTGAIC